jgi:beta-N-acetylhexosaminidase
VRVYDRGSAVRELVSETLMNLPNAHTGHTARQAVAKATARIPAGPYQSCRRLFAQTVALIAALTLALPAADAILYTAHVAYAKKRKQKPRSAAARKRQINRYLKRTRARVIRSHPAPADKTNPQMVKLNPPDPSRDGKPLSLKEKKAAVLAAPPEILKLIGRHIIVGYYAAYQLTPLLERGAIGGVFVTARNARRRSRKTLAKELASFKKMAAAAGQDTFWLATDQEGGSVSRLSPPLPHQPSLRNLLRKTKPDERQKAVVAYAEKQAKALAGIGINLNFAPVADINHKVRAARDRHTRIRYRAISTDPAIVTEVVRTYCEELSKAGIYCTLKHFPGLGRVAADTHVTSAHLKTPADVLKQSDWLPFREVIATSPAFVMVGHPHLESLDAERPASTSPKVIQKLLRDAWKFDGGVVTDDLAMGAIKRHYKGGMPQAAIDAVNAGADLVLIGSDGDRDSVYGVLYAMILAHEQGTLDAKMLTASRWRLSQVASKLTPPLPPTSESDAQAASKTKTAR